MGFGLHSPVRPLSFCDPPCLCASVVKCRRSLLVLAFEVDAGEVALAGDPFDAGVDVAQEAGGALAQGRRRSSLIRQAPRIRLTQSCESERMRTPASRSPRAISSAAMMAAYSASLLVVPGKSSWMATASVRVSHTHSTDRWRLVPLSQVPASV